MPSDCLAASTTSGDDFSRFGTVDSAEDPESFLRFLDRISGLASFRHLKTTMLARMDVHPGHRVLDVGCGVGGDVLALAALVAPGGAALGLDVSNAMVTEARRRAVAAGLPAEFHQGYAADVPFASGEFDAVRAERTLVHLPDADRAVFEMRRVLHPGGRAVVFDVDFESAVIDLPDPALTRRAVTALADTYASGRIGRRLPRVFRDAGFHDVKVTPHVTDDLPGEVLLGGVFAAVNADTVGEDDAERFHASVREAQADGRLFFAITGFVVSGRA